MGNVDIAKQIKLEKDPRRCKSLGHQLPNSQIWDNKKDEVMVELVQIKAQIPEIKNKLILFNSGINELTRFNEETGRYVMAFETAEAAVDHCLTAYQEFDLAFHQKYIHSHMIFGTITGMDIARYAYTQDKDPVHQLVINDTVRLLNREINNINERNWVPTCWLGSHVHRN